MSASAIGCGADDAAAGGGLGVGGAGVGGSVGASAGVAGSTLGGSSSLGGIAGDAGSSGSASGGQAGAAGSGASAGSGGAAGSGGGGGAVDDTWTTDFLSSVSRGHLDTFTTESPAVWSEAANLEALTVAYRATGDTRLLDELVYHADILFARQGDDLGFVDVVRGSAQPTWGTGNYSCDKYYGHVVHNGVLIAPILWFVNTVRRDPALSTYAAKAEEYLTAAEATAAAFSSDYKTSGSTGYYTHPAGMAALGTCEGTDYATLAGTQLPYNMMLAMMRAHLNLARAQEAANPPESGAAANLTQATRIAERFRAALDYHAGTQSYYWNYLAGGRPEDTAHAAVDIRAADHAHREGVVFNGADMTRLANAFHYLTSNPAKVKSHVDHTGYGSGMYEDRWQRGSVNWLALSDVDVDVYHAGRGIYYNENGRSLLATALLRLHRPDEYTYAIAAADYAGLPVASPKSAMRSDKSVGLIRTPQSGTATVDGKGVSSCVKLTFEEPTGSSLTMRYRHTANTLGGDSCSGSACGTSPGMHVFSSDDGSSWSTVSGVPAPLAEQYAAHNVTVPATTRHLMVCRATAGHARDNIQLVYVRDP